MKRLAELTLALTLLGCSQAAEGPVMPDPSKPVLVFANRVQGDLEPLEEQALAVSDRTGWSVLAVVGCGRCNPNFVVVIPGDVESPEVEPADHPNDCAVVRVRRGATVDVSERMVRFLR